MEIDQAKIKVLRYLSSVLNDIEATRIAIDNRARNLRSANIPLGSRWTAPGEQMDGFEADVRKDLEAAFREFSPALYQWAKDTAGIGVPGLARLIGVIGHPCYAFPKHFEDNPKFNASKPPGENNPKRLLVDDEPFERSVSDLWAYCGAGDARIRRRKGESLDENQKAGNPEAKMRSFLLVRNAAIMPSGYLRSVYLERKEHYADRVDDAGKAWTKGHIDNAARRFCRKAILKDIFNVAYAEVAA